MLDEADRSGIKVTNLALQKLLYFAHSIFLIEAKRPLVSGYFEAWQYGPVHPAAYSAFKTAGSSPIDFRATGQNVVIADGLKDGDRVVVEGFQKIHAGATVKPEDWKPPTDAASTAPDAATAG